MQLFDVQTIQPVAVLLHFVDRLEPRHFHPIGIYLAVKALRRVEQIADEIFSVCIFMRVVVIAEHHSAFVELRLDLVDFFHRRSQIDREIFRFQRGYKHAFYSQFVNVIELRNNIVQPDMRRNRFEIVFFEKRFHLGGRKSVKSRELHARITRFGHHFQYFFDAELFYLLAQRI